MREVSVAEIAKDVWEIESDTISQLKNTVDFGILSGITDEIIACKQNRGRVLTTGVGTSAVAACKIAHTLSCIEIPAFFLSPADGVHGKLGCLQGEDMLIAISKGGGTEEIMKLLPAVKAKRVKLIGVTENESSELAQASDIVLKISIDREPDPFNMLATASTLAVISVFDAIAIALMHITGYSKEEFALIHPGGDVGRRLLAETR